MLIAKVWNKQTGGWCRAGMQTVGPKEHQGKIWNLSYVKSAIVSWLKHYSCGRTPDHLEVVVFECKEITRIPAGEWRTKGYGE